MDFLSFFTLSMKNLFIVASSPEGELTYIQFWNSLVGGPELFHLTMPFADFHNCVGVLSLLVGFFSSYIPYPSSGQKFIGSSALGRLSSAPDFLMMLLFSGLHSLLTSIIWWLPEFRVHNCFYFVYLWLEHSYPNSLTIHPVGILLPCWHSHIHFISCLVVSSLTVGTCYYQPL